MYIWREVTASYNAIAGVVLLSANVKMETLTGFLSETLAKLKKRAHRVVHGMSYESNGAAIRLRQCEEGSPIDGRVTQEERDAITVAYTRLLNDLWKPSHFMIDKCIPELRSIIAGMDIFRPPMSCSGILISCV